MTVFLRKYYISLFLLSMIICLSLPASAQDEEEEKDPVKIFQQGQDAHEKGDLKRALELYNEALEVAPEFPEAEFQKGSALVSLDRLEEAEASFRRAIELRPDWTPAMAGLGALLTRTGKFSEAETLLTGALRIESQNFPALTALADLYLKTKAPAEKLKIVLMQLELLSSKARPPVSIWISRAAVERALGNNTAARASAVKALAIDPKNIAALFERAEASLALGDFNTAQNDAEQILKLSSNLLSAKLLSARARSSAGDLDETLKYLDTFDEASKQNAHYTTLRKAIVSAKSDSGENLVELEKQIAQDANNVAVLARLCVAARRTATAKSLEYCRRAAELEPANPSHATGYAAALIQAKQYAPAVPILQRVLAATPDNFTAHANLATALLELKRYPEAIKEYDWLVEKKPDLVIAYYFLGIAHDQSEKFREAMLHYKKFLTLADPSYNKVQIDDVNLRLPALAKEIEKLDKKNRK